MCNEYTSLFTCLNYYVINCTKYYSPSEFTKIIIYKLCLLAVLDNNVQMYELEIIIAQQLVINEQFNL